MIIIKLLVNSLISLGILIQASVILAKDQKEDTGQQPLPCFYTMSSSGADVSLDRGNIDRFLELTAVENPLQRVNTLTISGEWTAEDISKKLQPLLLYRIQKIDGALIRLRLSIDPKDLVVFNFLIPRSTKVI